MKLAGSELAVEEANAALAVATKQVEHSASQKKEAEEQLLEEREKQEAHMAELLGNAPVTLSAYEQGKHLEEADKLRAQVHAAVQAADSAVQARAQIDAEFATRREQHLQKHGGSASRTLERVHYPPFPQPSRAQRFTHQSAMHLPKTGAFGHAIPIDPYLSRIGGAATRPV